jgi:hypothetical protein
MVSGYFRIFQRKKLIEKIAERPTPKPVRPPSPLGDGGLRH